MSRTLSIGKTGPGLDSFEPEPDLPLSQPSCGDLGVSLRRSLQFNIPTITCLRWQFVATAGAASSTSQRVGAFGHRPQVRPNGLGSAGWDGCRMCRTLPEDAFSTMPLITTTHASSERPCSCGRRATSPRASSRALGVLGRVALFRRGSLRLGQVLRMRAALCKCHHGLNEHAPRLCPALCDAALARSPRCGSEEILPSRGKQA